MELSAYYWIIGTILFLIILYYIGNWFKKTMYYDVIIDKNKSKTATAVKILLNNIERKK